MVRKDGRIVSAFFEKAPLSFDFWILTILTLALKIMYIYTGEAVHTIFGVLCACNIVY
jgi:hypothetical protein